VSIRELIAKLNRKLVDSAISDSPYCQYIEYIETPTGIMLNTWVNWCGIQKTFIGKMSASMKWRLRVKF
jgi:hypothetical protein